MMRSEYREDPLWRKAQDRYLDPPGGNDNARLDGRIRAATAMFEIESATRLSDQDRTRIDSMLWAGGAA